MENLLKENEISKEKIRVLKEERDELKLILHIMTVHCCNLIAEKEDKKVEEIYKEIGKSVNKLMHGSSCQ